MIELLKTPYGLQIYSVTITNVYFELAHATAIEGLISQKNYDKPLKLLRVAIIRSTKRIASHLVLEEVDHPSQLEQEVVIRGEAAYSSVELQTSCFQSLVAL